MRRCPVCKALTDARVCPKDRIVTLLVDRPGIDVRALRPGSIIADRYEIEAQLGRGGFGVVFSARHTGTGQQVALKILASDSTDPDMVLARFFREAQITAALKHPNTVRVIDFGQDDAGAVYLAMELLRGRTLAAALNERRKLNLAFAEREVVELLKPICAGLEEAHFAGLVHRDLKPENIFLHEVDPSRIEVKVLDFGIAKLIGREVTLAQTVGIIGTPIYMSPEQVLGRAIDARSDIYSLGVIAFALVSGHPPFQGESPIAIMTQHAYNEPPNVRRFAKSPVSDVFASAVQRALAKDPKARFSSVRSFREAFDVPAAPAPAVAVREQPPRPRHEPQRRSTLRLWAAAAVVILAAGTGIAWLRSVPVSPLVAAETAPVSALAPPIDKVTKEEELAEDAPPDDRPAPAPAEETAPAEAHRVAAAQDQPAPIETASTPPPSDLPRKLDPAPVEVRCVRSPPCLIRAMVEGAWLELRVDPATDLTMINRSAALRTNMKVMSEIRDSESEIRRALQQMWLGVWWSGGKYHFAELRKPKIRVGEFEEEAYTLIPFLGEVQGADGVLGQSWLDKVELSQTRRSIFLRAVDWADTERYGGRGEKWWRSRMHGSDRWLTAAVRDIERAPEDTHWSQATSGTLHDARANVAFIARRERANLDIEAARAGVPKSWRPQ